MIETHPFGDFVPKKVRYLTLGSFPTKSSDSYSWFYANGRNQFWPILESVYGSDLITKEKKQQLFIQLEMALADIILSCERKNNSNLDVNLINIVCNIQGINSIFKDHAIEKIFFTSRYVETLFRKNFKELIQQRAKLELVCLPSPSPRYAALTKQQKIQRYSKLLPKLNH